MPRDAQEWHRALRPTASGSTTRHLVVDGAGLAETLREAARVLARGGVVVFPTESFYGLAVDPRNETAVAHLASIKGRQASKPIPLIAATVGDVCTIADLPPLASELADALWPCPLTMALEPRGKWPAAILGDTGTVGVRVTDHDVARLLAEAAGGLVTATSANRAGALPVAAPGDLDPDLVAGTQLIVDAGPCAGGAPSTVVRFDRDHIAVLREGAVAFAALEAVVGPGVCRRSG